MAKKTGRFITQDSKKKESHQAVNKKGIATTEIKKPDKKYQNAAIKSEDKLVKKYNSMDNYYDKVSNVDSALKYYQFVVDNYPDSEQSNFADERLFSINQALSLIHADSTSAPELAPN